MNGLRITSLRPTEHKATFILNFTATKTTLENQDYTVQFDVNDGVNVSRANDILKVKVVANNPDPKRTVIVVPLPTEVKTKTTV
jgi:hypothetical protein